MEQILGPNGNVLMAWDGDQTALAAKMVKVMDSISRVPKRGRNTYQNYDYVTDPDVADAVRTALVEQGLSIGVSHANYPTRTETDGKMSVITVALFITLTDADSGAWKTVLTYGEGADSQDKGVSKAMTAGVKYYWLKNALIPTGDEDPDSGPLPGKPPKTKSTHQLAKPLHEQESVEIPGDPLTVVMGFGKHRGKTLGQIETETYAPKKDSGYLDWMVSNLEPKNEERIALIAAAKAIVEDRGQAPHWINVPNTRSLFHARLRDEVDWTKKDGTALTGEEIGDVIHLALNVEHTADYPGTLDQAIVTIKAWVAELPKETVDAVEKLIF